MNKQAYGYLRVSGKGQVDGDGFARQEKAIRDYARRNRIEMVRFYKEEGVSGTVADRPALGLLVCDLEANGVKTVIVEKIDRLARDLMVQEAIIADFRKHGYELLSAMEGDDLLSDDPTRKLVRQVLGSIAEYDKAMIVAKLRAARERIKRANGKCEGRKSYRETAPEVVETIRKLRRKPRGRKGLTHNDVAETLNRMGYRTVSGRPFTGTNVSTLLNRL